MNRFNVSREVIIKLKQYEVLIRKWNNKINLLSSNDSKEIWERHIEDSLQLLNSISNNNICLVDIGSGAGFPGIVLSIAGIRKVILVESNAKKAAFLLQAATFSDNQILILNEKIEALELEADILTTRGLSKIVKIFELTKNYKINDKYLLLKGEQYNDEIQEANKCWNFNYKVFNSLTSQSGKIIEITGLEKNI